ncbi:hypothetical protein AB1Y20_011240 [Prymnesium parvum]|uniref:Uncharacterized protein n=1 Tax=Prymnesium parvum TaxID=97485 RepID=A0AB34IMB9_PRYPA
MSCLECLGGASNSRPDLLFRNTHSTAIGDSKIPPANRVYFAIYFPVDCGARPLWMFFSKFNEGTKVLADACKAGNIQLDRGRIVGSPDRLNLFTIEGDLLRVDLELEAHLGSTLQPSSVLILEKGNRVPEYRIDEIKASAARSGESSCSIM